MYKMPLMPNQPKTPLRSVRVEEALWRAVQRKASARGETVTDVIVRGLRAYANKPQKKRTGSS